MTSKIVVNNIEADAGVSTVTFGSKISATEFVGPVVGNVTGNVVIGAGTTSAPSLSPSGDSNTGIFFPSADTVCVGTGASEVVRITSGFNVGVNSTSPQTKLDVVGGIKGVIVQGTSQVSTAGTSIDFTGIPSWAKRVTVMFDGVSTNGSSGIVIQLGSGSFTTSGYLGSGGAIGNSNNTTVSTRTTGLAADNHQIASAVRHGTMVITNITGNAWTSMSVMGRSDTVNCGFGGGSVTLSGALDRVRITTVSGTDTFDAGSINILYEG